MQLDFFGYAFGLAGSDNSTSFGPEHIKNSEFALTLSQKHNWQEIIKAEALNCNFAALESSLAKLQEALHKSSNKFCVFGGDHTSAVASVQAAKKKHKNLKLIWVDAHMDLHNYESSHSKNIHGMSLGILLGQSDSKIKSLHNPELTIKPNDICIFGARSFEPEEQELAKKLDLNITYMSEIHERGLEVCWQEVFKKIQLSDEDKLMFSIDLDAFDPSDAPAVTVPEPNGINAIEFCQALTNSKNTWQKNFIGNEIVEFSPKNDIEQKTEKLIFELLKAIYN